MESPMTAKIIEEMPIRNIKRRNGCNGTRGNAFHGNDGRT